MHINKNQLKSLLKLAYLEFSSFNKEYFRVTNGLQVRKRECCVKNLKKKL